MREIKILFKYHLLLICKIDNIELNRESFNPEIS